jgi:hypothetical protein
MAALRALEVIVVLCNPVNLNEPYRAVMTLTVAAADSDEDGRSRKERWASTVRTCKLFARILLERLR